MTTVVVLDTETSGLDPAEGAALLETAYVTLDDFGGGWHYGRGGTYGSDYIAYEGEIPPQARAVHHISPDDVRPGAQGVVTKDEWLHGILAAEVPGEMVYAAHNAAFDRRFLPELTLPWICTYRCACHIWPDAPAHSNQVLRYYLGVNPPAKMMEGLAPHRALYDAAVTAAILQLMLREHNIQQLLHLTDQPVLQTRVRFGKHRGELWSEVPRDYVAWIVRRGDFDDDVMYTARHTLGLV